MSRDTYYSYPLWHVEDPTLSIAQVKLELLLDFDPPSHFRLPVNCPQRHGIRPSYAVAGGGSAGLGRGGAAASAAAAAATGGVGGTGGVNAASASGAGGSAMGGLNGGGGGPGGGGTRVPGDGRLGAFGRIGHVGVAREDPLVTQWRELGVPPLM